MAHIKCGGECPLYPAPPRPFINCYHFAKLLRTEAIYLVCAFLIPKEENGRKKDGKTGQPVPVICVPEDGLYVILTGGRDKFRLCASAKNRLSSGPDAIFHCLRVLLSLRHSTI